MCRFLNPSTISDIHIPQGPDLESHNVLSETQHFTTAPLCFDVKHVENTTSSTVSNTATRPSLAPNHKSYFSNS